MSISILILEPAYPDNAIVRTDPTRTKQSLSPYYMGDPDAHAG